MGGTVGKMLLAVAVAALLAVGLGACGGGDDDSTAAPTTGAGAATTPAPSDGGGESKEKQAGDDKGGSGSSGEKGNGSAAESKPEDESGARESSGAGTAEGSAAFRSKGGDNSIQDYGEEADGGEREAAESALVAYLDARANGEWAKSCQYLAASAVKPIEQLADSSPQLKGKSCGALIGALSAQLPASSRENPVTAGVASLRFEGERGFVLFHGPKGVDFFVPMVEEDGKWKVGALAPSEFP